MKDKNKELNDVYKAIIEFLEREENISITEPCPQCGCPVTMTFRKKDFQSVGGIDKK